MGFAAAPDRPRRAPVPAAPDPAPAVPAPEAAMALAFAFAGARGSAPAAGVVRRKCAQCAAAEELEARTGAAQRLCPSCERERGAMAVRRASAAPASEIPGSESSGAASALFDAVRSVAGSGGGRPLDPGTRAFFEAGFGRDLGGVRVHTGPAADASARGVNALAYTLGRDIVFRAGHYAPGTRDGERLLAHELAHTLQQPDAPARAADGPLEVGAVDDPMEREADAAAARVLRRQPATGGGRETEFRSQAPAAPGIIRRTYADGYGYYPYGGGGAGHPCPQTASSPSADFCKPFPTRAEALADRDSSTLWVGPSKGVQVLAGASWAAGDSRLASVLYATFIYGGSSAVEDASEGAGEFTASATTVYVTRQMVVDVLGGLTADRESIFPTFQNAPGTPILVPLSAVQRAGVDDQQSVYALNFCGLNMPGVLAGGIGKSQTSGTNPGADTSAAADDYRDANGHFTVTARVVSPDEVLLTVIPSVTFHVTDTIDFCPGNPGGFFAEFLTLPMSRWEASGISGDVTFALDFPAPPIIGQTTLRRIDGVVKPGGMLVISP
jgi:hypothetical protein